MCMLQRLGLNRKELSERACSSLSLRVWGRMAERLRVVSPGAPSSVSIGIVGKYTGLTDSYLSVIKALEHATMEAGLGLSIRWIESSSLEGDKTSDPSASSSSNNNNNNNNNSSSSSSSSSSSYEEAWAALRSVDGVVCPGGFGDRGIKGKALSAGYCRDNNKPYLGICLGMQTAVIEFARSMLNLEDADSEEFNPNTPHPVVISMPEHNTANKGGTMRLGRRATIIRDRQSLTAALYDEEPVVDERHRHRYEVNPLYVQQMEAKGLKFVGQDERGQRMEIAEFKGHPFFICTQYHPEFTSKPLKPNPLFLGLVLAAAGKLQDRLNSNGGRLRAGATYENM